MDLRSVSGKIRAHKKAAAGILLLLAAGGFLYTKSVSGLPAVSVEKAERETLEDVFTEEGRITAGDTVRYIAEVSGPVEKVYAEKNRRVKKGEVLFTISDSAYASAMEAAESEAAGYRAQLEQTSVGQVMTAAPTEYIETLEKRKAAADAALKAAKSSYEAGRALLDSGAISQNAFAETEALYRKAAAEAEEAGLRFRESREMLKKLQESGVGYEDLNRLFYESETARIKAALSAAEAEASFQKEQREKCTVMALEDGIVTDLPVKELSFITAGQQAAVISEERGLFAEADVLTSAALYIKEGDPVRAEISLKGKNLLLPGKVTEVYDYADQGTSALGLPEYRVHVRAELQEGPEASHGIEGYGADLKFTLYRGENVLTVPAGAVFETDGKEYVYLASGGRAVKTEVETEYKTAARAVIAGGLQEGSEVIREADAEGVFDGARIRVRR
ncbi:MAG: HlyD family efflux transporter periplasmic adaptor subunit [Stomatobaculum sp.]|nr:HlyD family efflux transporter periplasmic adaptor subunit [Stomatobaculum sp.]